MLASFGAYNEHQHASIDHNAGIFGKISGMQRQSHA